MNNNENSFLNNNNISIYKKFEINKNKMPKDNISISSGNNKFDLSKIKNLNLTQLAEEKNK